DFQTKDRRLTGRGRIVSRDLRQIGAIEPGAGDPDERFVRSRFRGIRVLEERLVAVSFRLDLEILQEATISHSARRPDAEVKIRVGTLSEWRGSRARR